MAFRNIPPNGFPAIPDIEDLEAVVKDVGTLKTTTAGLAEDVGDLEDQKVNQITIALPFNPETEYEVGDLVYYNGLSYRCTNEHTGEWDADDFAGTTIANELSSLRSGLTNLEATHLSFQRYSSNNTSYTFNVSPNKTNSFRAAIAIQHSDTNPSIYILYMGVGLTTNVHIDKIFGNSSIIALSSASINGDELTITYESIAYGGCSLLWLN